MLQTADAAIGDPDLRWREEARPTLVRSGTTLASTHTAVVDIAPSGGERRLIVEDAERVTVETDGALTTSTVVAYRREVITLPVEW